MTTEKNKQAIIRFNKEHWESGNVEITKELLADNYVNHFAPPNGPITRVILWEKQQREKKL